MSLDAHLVAADGRMDDLWFAEIGIEGHTSLFAQVDSTRSPLLWRMHEYYSDAACQLHELTALAEEAEHAEAAFPAEDPARHFLRALATKCREVSGKGVGVTLYAERRGSLTRRCSQPLDGIRLHFR